MSRRGGERRNKLHRGPPKANDHHNRYAKPKSQQSNNAYHGDPPRGGPGRPTGETKMEDKSQKEVTFAKPLDKQNAEEDVVKKELGSTTFDSNCNKSECVKIKTLYQKLLAEREHNKESIRCLKEEIQRLTSQSNAAKEITMEIDSSTKHTIAPRGTDEHVTGPSRHDARDQSSALTGKKHKLQTKEAKKDSRSWKNESLEELTTKNLADNSISEEDKHSNSTRAADGAGIWQSCVASADEWTQDVGASTQQDASSGFAAETKNNELLGDEESYWDGFFTYNLLEQNTYGTRCHGRGNEIGNRDYRPWDGRGNRHYEQRQHCEIGNRDYRPRDGRGNRHYEQRQQCEHGQQQGREGERWRNNQGEPLFKRKRVVNEIYGDLFTAPKTSSLAHCVAEDMRMGSGIAVTFRQMFKRVDELLAQGARTGEVAVLEDDGRFIYYLVTKKQSNGKPWLEDLQFSLIKMREHMLLNNVHDVAMPRIGCGLDRLQWCHVRSLLIEIFGEDDVSITVYNFNEGWGRFGHRSATSSRDSSLSGGKKESFKENMKRKDAKKAAQRNKKKQKRNQRKKHK